MMLIYKITNLINGKIYVGQTTRNLEKRFEEHKKHHYEKKRDTFLYRAMRKHGFSQFLIEALQQAESLEILNLAEQHWIYKLNSMNPKIGYNLQSGGLNCIVSNSTKAKLSKIVKEKCPEGFFKGRKHSEETKQKLRKIRALQKAPVISLEGRARISASKKGRPASEATLNAKRRPVKSLTTGVVYNSVTEAARAIGSCTSSIAKQINGVFAHVKGQSFIYSENKICNQ